MKISELLRGMLGVGRPSEIKILELRPGQVVRGVVTQLLEQQEVIVHIGSMAIRARLEANLKQGEATFLQVQPNSTSDKIILRPVSTSGMPLSPAAIDSLLRSLGLKQDGANRRLIVEMSKHDIPLTPEHVIRLAAAIRMPESRGQQNEWTRAATLALSRGLPLTAQTITALHEVLHGPPLLRRIAQLNGQIATYLGQATATAADRSVLTFLGEVSQLLMQYAEAASHVMTAGHAERSNMTIPLNMQPNAEYAGEAKPAENMRQHDPVLRLLRLAGLQHEHNLMRILFGDGDGPAMEASLLFADDHAGSDPDIALQRGMLSASVKSVLMQLASIDDIPASWKEGARQIVLHITGQQLMLHSDRSSPYVHLSVFIPFCDLRGEQTAAIQIQARRAPRGHIDASNCRLLFDLSMDALGDLIVDVHIVDQIVSLRVLNNHPLLESVLDESREQLSQALQSIGYQCISLQSAPYPAFSAGYERQERLAQAGSSRPAYPGKGVDMRI